MLEFDLCSLLIYNFIIQPNKSRGNGVLFFYLALKWSLIRHLLLHYLMSAYFLCKMVLFSDDLG